MPPVRSTSCGALRGALASAPTTQRPASLSSFSVRARLVTATTGVVSAAPAATLRAVALSCAARSRRHDHRERAAGIGGAQTRAEVVRVLHAIERQQQRVRARSPELLEQFVLAPGGERFDFRDHALVRDLADPAAAARCASTRCTGRCAAARQRFDLTHPRIRRACCR